MQKKVKRPLAYTVPAPSSTVMDTRQVVRPRCSTGPGGHLTRSGGADEIKAAVERHILPAVGPAGASGGTVGQRVVGPSVEQTIGV